MASEGVDCSSRTWVPRKLSHTRPSKQRPASVSWRRAGICLSLSRRICWALLSSLWASRLLSRSWATPSLVWLIHSLGSLLFLSKTPWTLKISRMPPQRCTCWGLTSSNIFLEWWTSLGDRPGEQTLLYSWRACHPRTLPCSFRSIYWTFCLPTSSRLLLLFSAQRASPCSTRTLGLWWR